MRGSQLMFWVPSVGEVVADLPYRLVKFPLKSAGARITQYILAAIGMGKSGVDDSTPTGLMVGSELLDVEIPSVMKMKLVLASTVE